MFKKNVLIILFSFSTALVHAQVNSDSLAYQLQRKKINAMLAQRALKFGQYDQSLSKHSGIFGLQTKKDIRRSNDILMAIVKTDNAIYTELKILLEFSAFQRTQVQNRSKEAEESSLGFMTTINKLRNQVDQMKADAEKQRQQYDKTKTKFIIAVILLSVLILYLVSRRSKREDS